MGLFSYSLTGFSSPEQAYARRTTLDRYGLYGEVSVIIVILAIQAYNLVSWLKRRRSTIGKEGLPGSPYLKANAEKDEASWSHRIRRRAVSSRWWLTDEVAAGWGTRAEYVGGGIWLLWLLILCVNNTGKDYMHLTRRFGIIAASQLPLHFLLAVKSPWSPLQLLTRMSHEELNTAHRVLGRVIQILFTLHAMFYLNFFVRINVIAKRIKDRDVIIGLCLITIITILSTSALATVRRLNYRMFYTIHAVLATVFLPLAHFHAHHIRPYTYQSFAILLVHIILRTIVNKRKKNGIVSLVPGTDLVKIEIPLNGANTRYKPGQHVYLSLPKGYKDTSIPSMLLRNPFTVASLPDEDDQIVLVARTLKRNTKGLAAIARRANFQDATDINRGLPLYIEGPYGAASYLPDFGSFDRVLLVAGGVGATFIVPLWRSMLKSNVKQNYHFVWAVRNLSEGLWALPCPELETLDVNVRENLETELYVTGVSGETLGGEAVEMAETEALVSGADEKTLSSQGIAVKRGRPDLHSIVAESFSGQAMRIAVLVCGPASMTRSLRHEVRRQVSKGKDIFWHAEEFGL